eukprot:738871-Rhodomonas_salina.1
MVWTVAYCPGPGVPHRGWHPRARAACRSAPNPCLHWQVSVSVPQAPPSGSSQSVPGPLRLIPFPY